MVFEEITCLLLQFQMSKGEREICEGSTKAVLEQVFEWRFFDFYENS